MSGEVDNKIMWSFDVHAFYPHAQLSEMFILNYGLADRLELTFSAIFGVLWYKKLEIADIVPLPLVFLRLYFFLIFLLVPEIPILKFRKIGFQQCKSIYKIFAIVWEELGVPLATFRLMVEGMRGILAAIDFNVGTLEKLDVSVKR